MARTIVVPSNEIASLKDEFSHLPRSMLDKLKFLHSEVFPAVNWGRLLIFLNFAEQLGLTVEEWNQLYHFLLPTLNRIIEWIFKCVWRRELSLTSKLHSAHFSLMGCCPPSSALGFERIFNRIRCVLACCGGKVIVQNSEFCDGEKAHEYLPRSKSSRKFRWFIWMLFTEQSKKRETVKFLANKCKIG